MDALVQSWVRRFESEQVPISSFFSPCFQVVDGLLSQTEGQSEPDSFDGAHEVSDAVAVRLVVFP